VTFLHTNLKLFIGYEDPALKTNEKFFLVLFYHPQFPKPRFLVHFLTTSTLQDSQWLKLDLRPEKFIAYLAPFIICPTKEKQNENRMMYTGATLRNVNVSKSHYHLI
jgi:hypothetical protein